MDHEGSRYKKDPPNSSRRGKCFFLMLAGLICLAASYFVYAGDITATADRSSLILGAFLGIVNLTMFVCIISAAVLLLADLLEEG